MIFRPGTVRGLPLDFDAPGMEGLFADSVNPELRPNRSDRTPTV
jgi:hypothetical protein